MSAEPISETGTQSRPRLAVVHTPTATVSTLGFVAIIAVLIAAGLAGVMVVSTSVGQQSRDLTDLARRRGLTRTEVLEAALRSFLSPDQEERVEALLTRRLDRIGRQLERIEWHGEMSGEALALFVRHWLTSTTPLPDDALPAAQASGMNFFMVVS